MKQFLLCLLLFTTTRSNAQELSRYLIRFTDKAHSPYTLAAPLHYLSQRAVDRRTRYNLAVDSTDLPVTPRYIDSLRLAGNVLILNSSRWLNQVSIQTTDAAALEKIRTFPFVVSATPIALRKGLGEPGDKKQQVFASIPSKPASRLQETVFDYGASYPQIAVHNGQFLHSIGLHGRGMEIGLLDGGFFNYTGARAFDSINQNGQVLGTYDFVQRESSVAEDDAHGMYCLSVIAGNIPGQFVGTAPKAGFYLFRTEDAASEYRIEEHNWVCGAERLDSAGGDVLSSSLGYSDFMSDPQQNYTYAAMDGKTTIAARGARLAAQKGLLVVTSAGNQGNEAFRYISTPADADSVLAVGATNTEGTVGSFSSYGPTADGRIKPDVASVGVQTTVAANVVETRNGTSFACPLLAGLVACLWQGFAEFDNGKIIDVLRRSGSKATAPDNRIGYGLPDMKKAVLLLLNDYSTASVSLSSCKSIIQWTSKDIAGMRYEIERRAPGENTFVRIGEKAAVGKSFSTNSYQFEDPLTTIPEGEIVYRIRQVIDTAFTTENSAGYIDTVRTTLLARCTTTPVSNPTAVPFEYTLLPNPVSEQGFRLRMTTPSPIPLIWLQIIDSKGRKVLIRKESKGAGEANFYFPAGHLARGTYYLLIYKGESLLATKEFIKL